MSSSVLSSAVTSASYNMVLQLLFRVLTFLLNAFILRFISKDMLGIVNVRLTLLNLTIQLVSREAFRRAGLSKLERERRWPQTINLLWMVAPIGIAWSCLFAYVWAYVLEQPDPEIAPNYGLAVIAFAVSTVIDLLSEPLCVTAQILLFVKLKVFVEGASLASRCILTVIFVYFFPHLGLIGFSIAQIVYSLCLSGMYYGYFIWYTYTQNPGKGFPFKSIRDFFPSFDSKHGLINKEQASLTWSFFKQSFLKQILTDGEKYVMTVFSVLSFGEQGIFDVISNLGSLAARFIFLPIEDSGYLFFSQTLQRGLTAKEQKQESITLASNVLECVLKFVSLLGMTILVFGYAYSYLLLDIYGGAVLSIGPGPLLLRCYCVYVLLLAINGTTECFAFATMSKHQVDRYNHKMLLFSVLFLASSWFFTRHLGSVGFILANCFNMTARIIHSIYHTSNYYGSHSSNPLRGLKPSLPVLAAYALAFVITVFSERTFCCTHGLLYKMLHIGIGASCLLLVFVTVLLYERTLINFITTQYKERAERKSKKD